MKTVTLSAAAHASALFAWLPLATLPAGVLLLGWSWPPWIFMWAVAFAFYASLKGLSYIDSTAARHAPPARSLAYFLLWPGMDADKFLADKGPAKRPRASEWISATAKLAGGLLLFLLAAQLAATRPTPVAWMGMIGLVLALHFGLFHLLSVAWRRAGRDAQPIMNEPLLAKSLSDFWGRRWNLAFRDLSHRFVYGPLHRRLGPAGATMAVFFVSGVVHDLVISVPARGGWGLPTAYFLLHGLGLLAERSRIGKKLGLRDGAAGRSFAAALIVLPLPLLFHPPFIQRVVVPMLSAVGAIG